VYEDVNYGGGAGRSRAAAGGVPVGTAGEPATAATVELYDAAGAFVARTLTSTAAGTLGQYEFSAPAGSYTVRVVSGTVRSTRPGAVAGLLPVPTYNGAGDRVGGQAPEKADAPANTGSQSLASLATASTAAQSVAAVTVGAAGAGGVDFGFNFDLVVNTNNAGQGSLRQFILNSNALTNAGLAQVGQPAGQEVSIFMIPDGRAHPGLRASLANQLSAQGVAIVNIPADLPTITDPNTTISGLTQTINIGNTNPAVLGTGGTVGVNAISLSRVNGPEVELVGTPATTVGLYIGSSATNAAIYGLALYGFGLGGDYDYSLTTGNIRVAANNVTVSQNVVGSSATAFADPGASTRSRYDNVAITDGSTGAVFSNNLVGFANGRGMLVASSVSSVTITNNELRSNSLAFGFFDGIDVQGNNTTVTSNLCVDNNGGGLDTYLSTGGNVLRGNTVSGNGRDTQDQTFRETSGIRLFGVDNTVVQNIISGNYGPGVLVTSGANANLFSRNSIFNNGAGLDQGGNGPTGQLGIDLLSAADELNNGQNAGTAPFVTLNDDGDGDAGGNNLLNYPVLETATVSGGNLIISGFAAPGALLEVFLAAPNALATGNTLGNNFGQGQTFVVAASEGSGQDLDNTTGSYGQGGALVNGFDQGAETNQNRFRFALALSSLTVAQQTALAASNVKLTATATVGGRTSEFSGNVAVGVPLGGVVYEDVNYGGGAGRSRAAAGGVPVGTAGEPATAATVELYDAAGAFVARTLTSTAAGTLGQYEFSAPAGSYTVRVVSGTVRSTRPGAVAGLLPVPTYNGAGDRVGGQAPEKADAPANTEARAWPAWPRPSTAAQSVAAVTVGAAGAGGVDFGFNFDLVVNTNNAGQGSLRQFILNSNALGGETSLAQAGRNAAGPLPAGRETSIFMIPSGQAVPGLRASTAGGPASQLTAGVAIIRPLDTAAGLLPVIGGDLTALDASTQSFNVGQTNGGANVKYAGGSTAAVGVGADGVIGTGDEFRLTGVDAPEVQLQGPGLTGNINIGLTVEADDVTLRGLAVVGFRVHDVLTTQASGATTDRLLVENNVFGAPASGLSDPGGDGRSHRGLSLAGLSTGTTARNNVFAFMREKCIETDANNTANLRQLTIEDNEFRNCGLVTAGFANNEALYLRDNLNDLTVRRNLFDKSAITTATNPGIFLDQFIEVRYTADGTGTGAVLIEDNSLVGALGNGILFWQSASFSTGKTATVRHNIIRDGRDGDAIATTATSANVVITQNAIFNNGSGTVADNNLGIDAGTNGVTINDLNDADAGPNDLLNSPVLVTASVDGGNLAVRGFARPGAIVELFVAAADPSGFGEGQTYLATATEGSANDTDNTTGAYGPAAINGVDQGQDNTNGFAFSIPLGSLPAAQQAALNGCGAQLTATATLGGTSEFSGNVTIRPAPITIRVTGPVPVCAGGTVRLSTGPRSGFLFTWYNGTAVVNGSGGVLNDSVFVASTAGSYTVQLTPAGCTAASTTSPAVAITVLPAITPGSIAADQTLCAGVQPAPFTSAAPATGGTGTLTYQWESSVDNTTWAAIAGATAADYAPVPVPATTYFRRQAISGSCEPVASNTVKLAVDPVLMAGAIGDNQTLCAGVTPAPLTSRAGATGGTGTYTYQWESSTDNANWAPIAGATEAGYSPAAVLQTTLFRRQVKSGTGTCATATSDAVTLQVSPALIAGRIAADQTLCSGTTPASLTSQAPATGGTGMYTYQWESSVDNTAWTAISGATAADYAPGPVSATTYFRRQESSGACAPVTSNTVALTIAPGLTAGTVGSDQTLCTGATPAPFTSTAAPSGGTGAYTYQWESSTDNASWTAISGATAVNYAAGSVLTTTFFRRQVTSGSGTCATALSNTLTITVTPEVAAGSIAADQQIFSGSTPAALTSTAPATGGTGTFTYQWEASLDNVTFTAIASATLATYAPGPLTQTTYFRRQVVSSTGTCAAATSNVVTITVVAPDVLLAGSIAADQTLCAGATPAALTSTAPATGGTGTFTYQWESSVDNTAWTAIAGATAATYAPGPLTQTTYFRRQVTSGTGAGSTAVTTVVTITVPPTLTAGSIAADQVLCAGATPAALTSQDPATGGTGSYVYQWESSADNTSWTAIAGATATDYAPGPVTAATYFRRQANSGGCAPVTSNTVALTIAPGLTAGTIGSDQALCTGATPAPFTSTAAPTGGTGSYTYQWESSADNAAWTAIAGATSAGYASGPLAATTYFRRQAASGAGCSAASNVVAVTVTPELVAGNIAADQQIPSGNAPAALTSTAPATGGTGTYAYQWESSADNTAWTAIAGATAVVYAPGPLTQTTYFRRQVASGTGTCAAATSNVVTITVVAPDVLLAGSIAADQTLCAGATPAALTSTAPATGGTGTFTYQWESSVDNTAWTAIAGATAATYAPGPLTQTTYFRRQVTSGTGAGSTALSNTVTITVTPELVAGRIAADQQIPSGNAPAALTSTAPATGGTGSYAYQWESSTDNATWTAVSGATAATYAPGPLTQTTYFRRQVVSGTGTCSAAVSNVVTVTVAALDVLLAGSVAADQILCAGATAAALTSTAPATGGTGSYAYQWESSANNTTWTAISGATAATYAPGPLTQTTYFRRQVTSGTGAGSTAVTAAVTITISPALTAGSVAADQVLCAGATPAALTSTAPATGGTGTYAYQWESSVDNTSWTSIAGATSAGYAPTAPSSPTFFRRRVTSGSGTCATALSNVVTITVNPEVVAGTIAADQRIDSGITPAPLASTAPATGGTGTYAYQWESSADNTTWTAIAGATSAGYAPGPLTQTTYFRRQVASGTCSAATSNVVTVTVAAPDVLLAGSIAADQTLCAGDTPTALTSTAPATGGTGTYAYQWESSADNTTWTAIAGATSAGYAPGPLTQTTYFRRQVASGTGMGSAALSNTVTITVTPEVVAGRIAADQQIPSGNAPAALTSTAPATGGTGTYAYQWESSPDNTTWTAISGATSVGYAPGSLTQTMYFRRQVVSGTGTCSAAVSNVVTVTVAAPCILLAGSLRRRPDLVRRGHSGGAHQHGPGYGRHGQLRLPVGIVS
jgi:parallel beta-helix repeat protein